MNEDSQTLQQLAETLQQLQASVDQAEAEEEKAAIACLNAPPSEKKLLKRAHDEAHIHHVKLRKEFNALCLEAARTLIKALAD